MIKEATLREAKETANLALLLWAGYKCEEFIQEIEHLISQPFLSATLNGSYIRD